MIDLLENYKQNSNEFPIISKINANFTKDQLLQAINIHYYGHDNVKHLNYANDCYNFISNIANKAELSNITNAKNTMFSMIHRYLSIMDWEKTKQVYVFDKDLISELARTDTDVILPKNVFDYLPCNSLCLDISSNSEICSKLNCDFMLVNINKIILISGQEFYTINFTTYLKEMLSHSIALTIENFLDEDSRSIKDILIANGDITSKNKIITEDEITSQNILVMQLLIYLSSIDPDIKETIVSKASRISNKNKKSKNKKSIKTIRTFIVGERFGEAYRTWIKSKSNQSYQNSESSIEKHIKPHFRRAHWHRYWVGKKNSNERRLVLKWTHQCFCGANDSNNLDIVKHKVN